MPAYDLVIFDCDGVLIDSEIVASRVDARILSEAGYEITPEEIATRFAGLTFKNILLEIEKETQLPLQASLIEKAETELDNKLRTEARAIEGAAKAVMAVPGKKCICSNSSSKRLDMMLKKTGLLPLFDGHIYSSKDTPSKQPKPAPDVFLFAAEKMQADPRRTFVIEDSTHGIAAATAAGMRVIGFTGGAHCQPGHADRLTEAGAETVIHRMADLGGVLAALSEWAGEV